MDKIVYTLCALTCGTCTYLLFRGYIRTRMTLLLWSTICFLCLTVANVLIYTDMIVFPDADLSVIRGSITFLGLGTLIYGMIRETV